MGFSCVPMRFHAEVAKAIGNYWIPWILMVFYWLQWHSHEVIKTGDSHGRQFVMAWLTRVVYYSSSGIGDRIDRLTGHFGTGAEVPIVANCLDTSVP